MVPVQLITTAGRAAKVAYVADQAVRAIRVATDDDVQRTARAAYDANRAAATAARRAWDGHPKR